MKKILNIFTIILLFNSCNKQDLATVKTNSNYTVTSNIAIIGGKVLNDGGCAIISKGICFGSNENPTISDTIYKDSTLKLEYKIEFNNLKPGSTYYTRAFVVNKIGPSYGELIKFSTLSEIKTDSVSKISSTSAISGGSILSKGNASIISKGICWSLNPSPTTSDFKTFDNSNSTVFTSELTSLTPGTIYYVRAFAINDGGVSYGNEVTFTTLNISIPSLTTNSVISITKSTASCGGNITSDGGGAVTSRGVCWSTNSNPTLTNSIVSKNGIGIGSYTSSVTDLISNTTYYVRAYATNSAGTAYGDNKTFKTDQLLNTPVVTTYYNGNPYYTLGLTTAKCGGEITSIGSSPIIDKGVCYGLAINPIQTDGFVSSGSGGLGVFTSSIDNLTPNKTYYVRAYAKNSQGISYGTSYSFTTSNYSLPTITSSTASSITGNSSILGGQVLSDGGTAVTARGVCWSTTSTPNLASNITTNGFGLGVFSSSLSGLLPNTTYYYRAYATNSIGTAYGTILSFTTLSYPVLTTTLTSSITTSGAISGGTITSDGGAAVTARGICWSTTSNPTLGSNKSVNGIGIGTFSSSITSLTPNTTYYVRAYATNSSGTSYGNQITFTTLSVNLPSITTNSATSILSTSASSGGNITSDGGATVTARGVCWSTTANPTLASNKTLNGLNIGSFSSSITGLTANTTYYVRAYATNSSGTSYGNQITFTTLSITIPSITTNSASSILTTTASSGGNIISDGGATVTARGICWSTSANPTLASNSTSNGLGVGSFISTISSLSSNTTYYVRAYATNSIGTAYGNTVIFTTSINIGDNYGGGKVAYILQSGDPGYVEGQNHGIIAAPSDQSTGIKWYNGTYTTTNASGTAIGTGNANTNAIVSSQGYGSYAAILCSDLVLGGYNDWYLPSKDELNKLYLNIANIGGFNTTALSQYWSSSQNYSYESYCLQFSSGSLRLAYKDKLFLVRAIRSF
jgi:hypothetical protein